MWIDLPTPSRGTMGASFLAALAALACGRAAAHAAESVQVTVESGVVAGDSDGAVRVFKGIPYALPPVGSGRWRAPEPPERWTGVRPATAFGPACPQSGRVETEDNSTGSSEDCLNLNVWAPARTDRPAPVMVWIHGGGNVNGSGARRYYDGAAFARDGVVLVTINYRLGLLGFFAHPALTRESAADAPLGNYGLMDQRAALRWVKANIPAFGGDPANVTVFGESAGGLDILALLATPSAADLFQRAIVESAGFWTNLPSLADAEARNAGLVAPLLPSGAVTPDRLRALSADELLKIAPEGSVPMVDGRLLPRRPEQAFAEGSQARVPLVIGTNSDEGSLVAAQPPSSVLSGFKPEELARARTAYGGERDDASLARALFRDLYFAAPARWIARHASTASAPASPVFLYRFSYVRRSQRQKVAGAPHGSEIPYVFDSWSQSPSGGRLLAAEDHAEAALMHACWVAFGRTGVPAGPASPAWPAYRPEADQLMDLGPEMVVRPADRGPLDFAEARVLTDAAH